MPGYHMLNKNLMNQWNILICLLFWNCIPTVVFSQNSLSDDGIRSTNALPPESYTFKFQSAGNVDHGGDYSASIPLMTLPGRNMDLPISLTYKSGITTDQRASWVGLGWNLNPGSITRIVNGLPDNVQYVRLPSDPTKMENGAVIDYPPMQSSDFYLLPEKDQFDYYLVNIPGIMSGMIVPVNTNNDSIPDYIFQEYQGYQVGFDIESVYINNSGPKYKFGTTFQRLYKNGGMSSLTREYRDIGWIRIRDKNGIYYEFALPLRSEMVINGIAPNMGPRFIVEYVSSWQLTAIYSEEAMVLMGNPEVNIPDDLAGTWFRFFYDYPVQGLTNAKVREIRPLYFDRNGLDISKDPLGLLTQTTFLSKIVSPTHEVVFKSHPRTDISFLAPYNSPSYTGLGTIGDFTHDTAGVFIKPLRLDTVILKQRFPNAKNVMAAKLTYASSGSELCTYGLSESVAGVSLLNVGKTTLKEVWVSDSLSGYAYKFKYTDQIDGFNPYHVYRHIPQNNLTTPIAATERYVVGSHTLDTAYSGTRSFYRSRSGRAGYLYAKRNELSQYSSSIRNTHGAAAWSLRTIEYPTGIVDTIAYEADYIDHAQEMINFTRRYKGIPLSDAEFVTQKSLDSVYYLRAATDEDYYTKIRNRTWANLAPDELGIRVRSISSYDPLTQQTRRTTYEYSNSFLPGLPEHFIRNPDSHVGTNMRRHFVVGNASGDVCYGQITKKQDDNSKVVEQYYKGGYNWLVPDHVSSNHSFYLVDQGFGRGKLEGAQYYSASGEMYKKEGKNLYINIIPAGFFTHPDADSMYLVNGDSVALIAGYVVVGANNDSVMIGVSRFKLIVVQNGSGDIFDALTASNYSPFLNGRRLLSYGRVHYVSDTSITYETNASGGRSEIKFITGYIYDFYEQMYYRSRWDGTGYLINNYTYAYYDYPQLASLNRLNELSSTLVQYKVKSTYTTLSSASYHYRPFNNQYRIYSVYEWRDDNRDVLVTDDEMKLKVMVHGYDKYGNPLKMTDAMGVLTTLEWSPNYNYSKLTKKTTLTDGLQFFQSYTYSPSYVLDTITDENGLVTRYQTDGFGRLHRMVNPAGQITKEYRYYFKNQVGTIFSQQ